MDFSNFELWSIDKLIETIDVEEVKEFVKSEHDFWTSQSETKIAKDWLSWCKKQQNTVKIVEYDIPDFVKPSKTNICLYDIKVSEKKIQEICVFTEISVKSVKSIVLKIIFGRNQREEALSLFDKCNYQLSVENSGFFCHLDFT